MDLDNDKYKDIINLPHHVSIKHKPMSLEARSAQFAPFAALTGYEDSVNETARLTDKKIELDEEEMKFINNILQKIKRSIKEKPKVTIIYFIPDKRKEGGSYITANGCVTKIDEDKLLIVLDYKLEIKFDTIIKITIED